MPNPFWNSTERRPRAFWRILIQGLLFVFLLGLFNGAVRAAAALIPAMTATDWMTVFSRGLISLGAIGAALLATWLAGRFLDRRPFASFGFHFSRVWWLDLLFGLVLGGVLMALIFSIERALGWITVTGSQVSTGWPFWPAVSAALLNFIAVGIYEEILSRGVHLRNMAEGFNRPAWGARAALLGGYILSSSLFAVFHLGNPNASWVSTLALVAAGLLLGLGFILTGELAIAIGIHITWNFFQGNVFGFPVSGTQAGATLIGIQQGGPVLWTGGDFGPEAGLIGVLATFLGCLLTWLYVRATRRRAALRDDLAVYIPPAGLPLPVPAREESLP